MDGKFYIIAYMRNKNEEVYTNENGRVGTIRKKQLVLRMINEKLFHRHMCRLWEFNFNFSPRASETFKQQHPQFLEYKTLTVLFSELKHIDACNLFSEICLKTHKDFIARTLINGYIDYKQNSEVNYKSLFDDIRQ